MRRGIIRGTLSAARSEEPVGLSAQGFSCQFQRGRSGIPAMRRRNNLRAIGVIETVGAGAEWCCLGFHVASGSIHSVIVTLIVVISAIVLELKSVTASGSASRGCDAAAALRIPPDRAYI